MSPHLLRICGVMMFAAIKVMRGDWDTYVYRESFDQIKDMQNSFLPPEYALQPGVLCEA